MEEKAIKTEMIDTLILFKPLAEFGETLKFVATATQAANRFINQATIIWNTVHPVMRPTAILSGGELRTKGQIPVCWRSRYEQ